MRINSGAIASTLDLVDN